MTPSPPHPALHAHDLGQLQRVVALVDDIIGPGVVGAYLFGSAVFGELRPRSDLDVFAVVARPTTAPQKRRLVESLLAISGHQAAEGSWRRVELTIVVQHEIKPWRYPPRFDFQYGDWLRNAFEHGDLEPWPDGKIAPDLTTLVTMVRRSGVTLLGAPPGDVLDAAPPRDLIRAGLDAVEPLLHDLPWDTANVILTLCRIWSTAGDGELRSKDEAAKWALARLSSPHSAVVARAVAVYIDKAEDRWDDLQPLVPACAEHIVAELRALSA